MRLMFLSCYQQLILRTGQENVDMHGVPLENIQPTVLSPGIMTITNKIISVVFQVTLSAGYVMRVDQLSSCFLDI